MSIRNEAAWLAKKEIANTLNNVMHSSDDRGSIFDMDSVKQYLLSQYDHLEKEIKSDFFMTKSDEEKNDLLRRFYNCCKGLGRSFNTGVINGIEYKISKDNPKKITFNDLEHGIFVVIDDQGMYSELCVNETNHYANLKHHDFTIVLNNKIYVVDGEINEYIEIFDDYLGDKSLKDFYDVMKPLCADIVSKNREYTLSASGLGFYRTEISPEEKIKSITELSNDIVHDNNINIPIQTNQQIQSLGQTVSDEISNMKYSDLVVLAEKFNNRCLQIYNIIQSTLNSEYILGNKSR